MRPSLRPLLGPRPVTPVLAGAVTGAAVAGVLQALGPAGVPTAGYLGLVDRGAGRRAGLPASRTPWPAPGRARAGRARRPALSVVRAAGRRARLTALALLLLTAAVPAVLVAARQPADRPGALPVTLGCLAGSALLAEADGSLTPGADRTDAAGAGRARADRGHPGTAPP